MKVSETQGNYTLSTYTSIACGDTETKQFSNMAITACSTLTAIEYISITVSSTLPPAPSVMTLPASLR